MFLDCPAYLDEEGTIRCGLPAEVRYRFTMRSTGGPLEAAMIRCPAGHWFNGPIESLTWQNSHKPDHGTPAAAVTASRDSLTSSHDGRGASGRLPVQAFGGKPEQRIPRPATAPAYYLGRPARVWITAMRPRRARSASDQPVTAAVTGGERTPSQHGLLAGAHAGTGRAAPASTPVTIEGRA
jgi:hypothetical protein